MEQHWNFPTVDGGQFHGIGDSGMDLFSGAPVKSLAREICQNSIDARLNEDQPVRVEFKAYTINTADIPGRDELLLYYKQAYSFVKKQQKMRKAEEYFEKTIPLLEDDVISVLRISDFHTSGLTGSSSAGEDYTTPWFKLVRSVSSSDKIEGSIGSYGSGKMAAFACSDLQTVFYSTRDMNGYEAHQGVSKLICFKDDEGKEHLDVGYFSEPHSLPIQGQMKFETGFCRTESESGTDILVLGYRSSGDEWIDGMVVSVLDGFFYAIMKGHLEVDVGGELINSASIGGYIEKYSEQINERTHDYFELLNDPNLKENAYSFKEENDIKVYMAVRPGLHKRVAIIRYPGMKVFDKGDISSTVSFAGVCIIEGEKIATLLGGMENIQHNKWELERYKKDPDKKRDAKSCRDKLYKTFRDLFNELKGKDASQEFDPGVGDALPDPFSDNEEEQEALNDQVFEVGKQKTRVVRRDDDTPIPDENGEDNGDSGDQDGTGGGGSIPEPGPSPTPPEPGPIPPGPEPIPPAPGPGPEPGPNPEPTPNPNPGKAGTAKVIRSKIRVMGVNPNMGDYMMLITPEADLVEGKMVIKLAAESDSYDAEVISASQDGKQLNTESNTVTGLNAKSGERIKISVRINYSDICPMEVKVYGNQV